MTSVVTPSVVCQRLCSVPWCTAGASSCCANKYTGGLRLMLAAWGRAWHSRQGYNGTNMARQVHAEHEAVCDPERIGAID